MKRSRFNHFFPVAGGDIILAYNSFSGELAEIDRAHYARVQELLANPQQAMSPEDKDFVQCLTDGGFLIPDGVDQIGMLRQVFRRGRTGAGALTLIIAPTLACNFDCPYCFERRSAGVMKEEVQDALLRFTERELVRTERLRIKWFGGEPTLCMGLIERLHGRLTDLAVRRNVEVMPHQIITNGYLLDAAMARRLQGLGVEIARVTIDGPQSVHDSRRMLRSGEGTYRRIIENLAETVDILQFEIQINVDRSNIETAYGVLEELDRVGVLPKVMVSFAQVNVGVQKCTSCVDSDGQCYTNQEFAQVLASLYRRMSETGIAPVQFPSPRPNGGYCSALMETSYVVAPNGLLFKCTEELSADPGLSVGDVFGTPLSATQRANLESYRRYDPFALRECLECSILPVCAGGCPLQSKELTQTGCGKCIPGRYNLAEMIESFYRAAGNQTAE